MPSDPSSKSRSSRTVPYLKVLSGIFKFVENPIPIINEALDTYGTTYYTRIIGGKRVIMTIDPDVVQHVLQKNHKNYFKSELQTKSLGRYIGNGLLTSNGAYWLRQRRLIQPGFHKARMIHLVDIMNEEILNYCESLDSRLGKQYAKVDLSPEMMELTLRVVSKALFSSGISQDKIKELGEKFTSLQLQIVKEVRQPFLNPWRVLTGKRRRTHELADDTKQIVRDIIAARQKEEASHGDLLDMLLETRYEDTGQKMEDQQLLDESIILFTAGHETTANALAWTFHLLDRNPQVYEKLKAEIDQFPGDLPDYESVRDLKYTAMVINESLRLYPPAWILDRVALADDEVKDVHIRKGDMVGLFVYGTHRSAALWDEPEAFIPERFAPENAKSIPSYAYYPFGGGPRLCIGNHFALLEMQLSLFHLIRRYSFEGIKDHPVAVQPLITLRPKYGIQMRVEHRFRYQGAAIAPD